MLRLVGSKLEKTFRASALLAAVALALCWATPIARQDATALFRPFSPKESPVAISLASGSRVSRGENGQSAQTQPILSRAIVFSGSQRLMVENAEGDITGNLAQAHSSQAADVRVNRAAKRDLQLTTIEKSPDTSASLQGTSPFQQALVDEGSEFSLKRGFARILPTIYARLDALAPLPLARPSDVLNPSGNRLADLSIKTAHDLERAHACLAQAIYHESRSEPVRGQQAVAQVVLNRVKSGVYPSNICGVIFQNQHWRNRCQFSFACDGTKKRVNDQEAWETANRVADDAIAGRYFLQEIGDATHYHAAYVAPRWRRSLQRMKKIGEHIFYAIPGVAINDEP